MTVLLLTAAFVFAAIAVGAVAVLLIVVGEVQRMQAQLRKRLRRPVISLSWMDEIPMAHVESGDVGEAARWLEAVGREQPVIHA